MVYADDLVVGAGSKIAAVGGESNGVNCAQVVAHVTELARLRVGGIVGLVYRLGGPNSDVAICVASGNLSRRGEREVQREVGCARTTASRCKPRPVRGDMAAVNLEVLLFACRKQ